MTSHMDKLANLLKWAVGHTDPKGEGEEGAQKPRKMEPIDAKWIDALLGEPDIKKMRMCIQVVDHAESSSEEKASALEELQFFLEDLNNANDLHKIDGIRVIKKALSHESAPVRMNAAWALASALSNNPLVQKEVSKFVLLPVLLDILNRDEDMQVRGKALFALSGLIRHHRVNQDQFAELGGFQVLCQALVVCPIPVKRKGVFLLSQLMAENETVAALLCDIGVLPQLLQLLRGDDYDLVEKTLDALIALVPSYAPAAKVLGSYGALDVLQDVTKTFEGDEDISHRVTTLRGFL